MSLLSEDQKKKIEENRQKALDRQKQKKDECIGLTTEPAAKKPKHDEESPMFSAKFEQLMKMPRKELVQEHIVTLERISQLENLVPRQQPVQIPDQLTISTQPLKGHVPVIDENLLNQLPEYLKTASKTALLFCIALDATCPKRLQCWENFAKIHDSRSKNVSPELFWYYFKMVTHQLSITDWDSGTFLANIVNNFKPATYENGTFQDGVGRSVFISACMNLAKVEVAQGQDLLMGQVWKSTHTALNGLYPQIPVGSSTFTLSRIVSIFEEGFAIERGQEASHYISDMPANINCVHIIRESRDINYGRQVCKEDNLGECKHQPRFL